jgi:hypothetical protein
MKMLTDEVLEIAQELETLNRGVRLASDEERGDDEWNLGVETHYAKIVKKLRVAVHVASAKSHGRNVW